MLLATQSNRSIALASYTPTVSVGTQIIVSIVVGLLIAFAVQFLLTNLGLALGISVLKYIPQASEASQTSKSDSSKTSVNITLLAGLGIIFTLNLVLFVACFFAVRFSTANDPISGATLGIVIWSTYFLILLWVSYSAVGSLIGWLFGSLTTKLRQLIEAISSSIQATEEPASELLTEEAAAKLIHQEIQTALNEFDLQKQIEEYLKTIPQPKLDLEAISQGFADLLEKTDLESLAGTNLLQKIDRQTFIELIEEKSNLSASEAEQIVDRLSEVWQQAIDRYEEKDLNAQLLHYLQSANPEELQFERLIARLEKLVGKESQDTSTDLVLQSEPNKAIPVEEESLSGVVPNLDKLKETISLNTLDWRSIKSTLLNRIDLSEVELSDIWHSLQSFYQQINSEEGFNLPFNTIQNDVEDYLWHAPPWYLKSEKGWQEFKEVIYDPQADTEQVRSRIKQIQPEDFREILQQRDDLDSEEIDAIAEHLETVREEVLDSLDRVETQEQNQELSDRLKNYLQTTELMELQGDNLSQNIEQLLIKGGVSTAALTQFLSSWQQIDWQSWLQQRQDLEPNELKKIADNLEKIDTSFLEKLEDWQAQITSKVNELEDKLESYLRYTHLKYLTPENIDAKLEELWQKAFENYLPEIQQPLPEIDRSRLVKIIERRKGLDLGRVEEIAEQIETKLSELSSSLTPNISQLQVQATELSEKLLDYLEQKIEQKSNLAEINAELPQLFNLAKRETSTLIKQLNWDEIETKLKHAQKYSQKQIEQTIKQSREAISKLIKLPRRWATRTSRKTRDVINELEDFLSHSNKNDLTPENLERNLSSILATSKTRSPLSRDSTAKKLDSLAKITPTTAIESLSSRQDFTPVEIEEISDRFMATVDRLTEEIKTTQKQTNQLIGVLLDRISEYLSSLNLDRLDLDRIKANLASVDFQALTDSWKEIVAETPLEQLGDRLGQLSYETLIAIDKTSTLFSDSILEQIQGIRDNIDRQIETIKLRAYEKTETIKQQTLQQVEATRKAIALAAYWMLAITFTSAITSAVAGFLATKAN